MLALLTRVKPTLIYVYRKLGECLQFDFHSPLFGFLHRGTCLHLACSCPLVYGLSSFSVSPSSAVATVATTYLTSIGFFCRKSSSTSPITVAAYRTLHAHAASVFILLRTNQRHGRICNMTVLNIKDRVKNNKLNLSGLNLTEIPVKEIVSSRVICSTSYLPTYVASSVQLLRIGARSASVGQLALQGILRGLHIVVVINIVIFS